MSSQGDDAQDEAIRQSEAALVDNYVRRRFGVEHGDDRSGLFTGEPLPTAGESDEEGQFDAYMQRYFAASQVATRLPARSRG